MTPVAQTFTEFLERAARQGEVVNIQFEDRLFALVGILGRIAKTLDDALVPYQLIGGLAVFLYLEEAESDQAALTRDVDLMVHRSDLDKIRQVAASAGFRFRYAASVDMLTFGETDSAKNAVHLLFSGEKVRPEYVSAAPPIRPEVKSVLGRRVMVISVADLVTMKLTANRDKDRVHLRALDDAGLITEEMVEGLPPELAERLRHVRETE